MLNLFIILILTFVYNCEMCDKILPTNKSYVIHKHRYHKNEK